MKMVLLGLSLIFLLEIFGIILLFYILTKLDLIMEDLDIPSDQAKIDAAVARLKASGDALKKIVVDDTPKGKEVK